KTPAGCLAARISGHRDCDCETTREAAGRSACCAAGPQAHASGAFHHLPPKAERMGNRRNLSREEKAGKLRPMRPVPLIWCNSLRIANEIAGQVSSAAISRRV